MDKSNSLDSANNKERLRIVFFGTPEFAVPCVDALYKAGFDIVGVVTAPDRRAGRGMHVTGSPVKQWALEKGIAVLQPEKLKSPVFLDELRGLSASLHVVVAFRMLPELVWGMPEHGTINLHASLLPDYRGAAPINWAIINGEHTTGLTTFKLQQAIDTGDILLQEQINIGEDETFGELHDRMKEQGASLLARTVQGIEEGTLKAVPQELLVNTAEKVLHPAPKLFTQHGLINWGMATQQIHNLIRGLSPYPAAYTQLNNKLMKIYASKCELCGHGLAVGEWLTDNKTFLKVACADGFVHLLDVQMEGKKRLGVGEFLRGFKLKQ